MKVAMIGHKWRISLIDIIKMTFKPLIYKESLKCEI